MRKLILIPILFVLVTSSFAQGIVKANYRLASRYSPKKVDKMVFSTTVDPHWLKYSDRFWYTYETPGWENVVYSRSIQTGKEKDV